MGPFMCILHTPCVLEAQVSLIIFAIRRLSRDDSMAYDAEETNSKSTLGTKATYRKLALKGRIKGITVWGNGSGRPACLDE